MSEPRKILEPLCLSSARHAAALETSSWIAGEPSVQEMLCDPLIHSILRRDGLSLHDFLQAVAQGRDRLAVAANGITSASGAA